MRWQTLTMLFPALAACDPDGDISADLSETATPVVAEWRVEIHGDFDTLDHENWQAQLLWINDEDQCYVPDGKWVMEVDRVRHESLQ